MPKTRFRLSRRNPGWSVTVPIILLFFFFAGAVAAQKTASSESAQDKGRLWHVGLNLRTDFGTHPIRLDGGIQLEEFDVILVLDPMVLTDGQHDLDLWLDWRFSQGWSSLIGLRATSIGLASGRQWHQKLLIGICGRLPSLFDGDVRAQWGFELSVLWLKHGGGLPTEGISFASGRHVSDHINFGMFFRLEYGREF